MKSKYAPICVFTYKRFDHTKKMMEALANNSIAKESDLFIFCDNYKTDKDKEAVEKVHDLIKGYQNDTRFNTVTITFAQSNKGLARSIIDGATQIIEEYGRVIVLEDDLITSADCLEYFNSCLDFYDKDNTIWSISGYSFPMQALNHYKNDVYLSPRGCSWGWATWKDRWEKVDWEVSDYKSFQWNFYKRRQFSMGGFDMPAMLDRQINGFNDSWAIRWCYSQWKLSMYTVYPKISRIANIGLDGSGTNSKATDNFDTELSCDNSLTLCNLTIDKKICTEFRQKFYVHPIYRVAGFVKNNVLHIKYLRAKRYKS